MKIRMDFVTNSSSSSFVAILDAVLENGERIRAVDEEQNGGEASGTIVVRKATGNMDVRSLRYVKNLQDVIVKCNGEESRIVSGSLSLQCHTYGEYIWEAYPETMFDKYTIGNAFKTVKSLLPARYNKDKVNELIAKKEQHSDLARLSDESIRTLAKYVYVQEIEADTEIVQTFYKDGTQTIQIENDDWLFDTEDDWQYFNKIPDKRISFTVKEKQIIAEPEKPNKPVQDGGISKRVPANVSLTDSQQAYLKAATELLAKQDHVKMVDVARYMNKSTGSAVDALRKLEKLGVLSISDTYEISLNN